MVKHIICFKLKEGESVAKARDVLLSMEGNVPQLRGIEVGEDFLHSPRSYDLYLSVLVDDREALDAYQKDPYHVGVVKEHMHRVVEASVAVDFVL